MHQEANRSGGICIAHLSVYSKCGIICTIQKPGPIPCNSLYNVQYQSRSVAYLHHRRSHHSDCKSNKHTTVLYTRCSTPLRPTSTRRCSWLIFGLQFPGAKRLESSTNRAFMCCRTLHALRAITKSVPGL